MPGWLPNEGLLPGKSEEEAAQKDMPKAHARAVGNGGGGGGGGDRGKPKKRGGAGNRGGKADLKAHK